LVLLVVIVVGPLVGWRIGVAKGWPVVGALLGLVAPLGWIVMLFVPRRSPSPTYDAHLDHAHEHRPG
jgi:hypothetical protein